MKKWYGTALFLFLLSAALAGNQGAAAEETAENPAGLPVIIAHEGASQRAPENTEAAFREAAQTGADGVETDIRMTKDGQLVLSHDDQVDQTSSGAGSISDLTLEELKSLDYGAWYGPEFAGETILTLEEFFTLAKELDFQVINLEMKPQPGTSDEYVREFAEEVLSSGLADRIQVSSFDPELLRALKEQAPDIRTAILTLPDLSALAIFNLSELLPKDKPLAEYTIEDLENLPRALTLVLKGFGVKGDTPAETAFTVIRGIAAAAPEGATWNDAQKLLFSQSDLISYMQGLDFDVDYLNCHHGTLTTELVEEMRTLGIGVNVWTPNSRSALEKAIGAAPDGIITDKPELAMELLAGPAEEDAAEAVTEGEEAVSEGEEAA